MPISQLSLTLSSITSALFEMCFLILLFFFFNYTHKGLMNAKHHWLLELGDLGTHTSCDWLPW